MLPDLLRASLILAFSSLTLLPIDQSPCQAADVGCLLAAGPALRDAIPLLLLEVKHNV